MDGGSDGLCCPSSSDTTTMIMLLKSIRQERIQFYPWLMVAVVLKSGSVMTGAKQVSSHSLLFPSIAFATSKRLIRFEVKCLEEPFIFSIFWTWAEMYVVLSFTVQLMFYKYPNTMRATHLNKRYGLHLQKSVLWFYDLGIQEWHQSINQSINLYCFMSFSKGIRGQRLEFGSDLEIICV